MKLVKVGDHTYLETDKPGIYHSEILREDQFWTEGSWDVIAMIMMEVWRNQPNVHMDMLGLGAGTIFQILYKQGFDYLCTAYDTDQSAVDCVIDLQDQGKIGTNTIPVGCDKFTRITKPVLFVIDDVFPRTVAPFRPQYAELGVVYNSVFGLDEAYEDQMKALPERFNLAFSSPFIHNVIYVSSAREIMHYGRIQGHFLAIFGKNLDIRVIESPK